MGQNNTIMKINEMPAKTWYRLNLNEVKLPWTEGGEQKTVKTDGEESPVFLTLSGTDYEKKIIEININTNNIITNTKDINKTSKYGLVSLIL